jgi:hypothetical protein
MFAVDVNSVLRYLKLLTLALFLDILEIFPPLALVLHVKIVHPLDVLEAQ